MSRERAEQEAPWLNGWPEIHDPRIREAFTRIPRAAFVDEEHRQWALRDAPLPIDEGQTISQPFIVALMTQALALQPGQRVLEIGTGSGFQTAVLCELTARPDEVPGRYVWSVERFPILAQRAAKVLRGLGYLPHLYLGDGAAGWPAAAPYDAIVVTAAASALPLPLWQQLGEGGRMVIPIGPPDGDQTLWWVGKRDERLFSKPMGPVRFVPVISPILDDPTQRIELDPR